MEKDTNNPQLLEAELGANLASQLHLSNAQLGATREGNFGKFGLSF